MSLRGVPATAHPSWILTHINSSVQSQQLHTFCFCLKPRYVPKSTGVSISHLVKISFLLQLAVRDTSLSAPSLLPQGYGIDLESRILILFIIIQDKLWFVLLFLLTANRGLGKALKLCKTSAVRENAFVLSRRDHTDGRISVSQRVDCGKSLALGATNSFPSKAALPQPLPLVTKLYDKLFGAKTAS